jgi:hypothetical protein
MTRRRVADHRVFEPGGDIVHVAALGQEVIRDMMIDVERLYLGGDEGRLVEQRIGYRRHIAREAAFAE